MRLSGAVFRVWADSNNDGKLNRQTDESIGVMKEIKDADGKGTGEYEMTGLPYDSNGNAVDTLKEVSEGVYELDGLTVGNYTLKEIKAPVGFLLDTNAYNFSIVNDGNVISIETKAGIGFINTPIKGTISVVKVDEKTKSPCPVLNLLSMIQMEIL